MTTLLDIENALVKVIVNAIYPNGTTKPSIANTDIFVNPGWPIPADLDKLLRANKAQITVFALSAYERKLDYLGRRWREIAIPPATSKHGVIGTAAINVKRQEQGFLISIWTNNPNTRDLIGSTVDAELAYIQRLTLAEQLAPLRWLKTVEIDDTEKQNIYRRDLYYTVEYETFKVEKFPTITEIKTNYDIKTN